MTNEQILDAAKWAFDNDVKVIKWLEALLSGDYKQTKHMLHSDENNGFCCVGVYGKVSLGKRLKDISTLYGHEENSQRKHISETYSTFGRTMQSYGIDGDDFIMANDSGESFEYIAEEVIDHRMEELGY